MFRIVAAALALMLFASVASAEIKTLLHDYKEGDTTCEAFVAWDDSITGKRPAVLIVHQWMGIQDHERDIAVRLAEMGYVAFCADIYGKGVRPTDVPGASAQAGNFRGGDRANFRARLDAAVNELRTALPELVDNDRIAAIGYCFGGTAVLELARMNAPVAGVASFHGGLGKGDGPTAANIAPKVLVLHGYEDPYVPPAEVEGLLNELRAAGADWELVAYSNAVHSFTDRKADSDGARYDARADRRSWARLNDFLDELFKR
jgi:dienelactone hydrolase